MTDRPPLLARVGVWVLVLLMLAAAGALWSVLPDGSAPVDARWWLDWWVLLPVFALAEIFVVHLPTHRGSAHTHSLREVPSVLGLVFLSPVAYLGAHLVGTGLALVLHRRQRGAKLAFNLSWFALEVALGVAVYRLVLGPAAPDEPRGWLAAVAAAVVTDLVSAVLITAVVGLHERELDRSVIGHAVTRGMAAAAANTCLASLVVVLVIGRPAALPLLLVVLLALFLTYRAYLALWVGHTRVRRLYALVQETGSQVSVDELVDVVVHEARDVMQSSAAELVLVGAADSDDAGPPAGRWWVGALEGELVVEPLPDCAEHGHGCRGGLAAPVRSSDGAVVGALVVHDRTVDVDPFTAQDAELFTTVAAHAAVALDNARLLDELRREAVAREHQARHDEQTGLPNRVALNSRIGEALDTGAVAVLLLGLDDLERVNEVLGHAAGESLLWLVAERLREVAGDAVCRLDGADFAVVVAGRAAGGARELAEQLLGSLRRPLLLRAVPLYVTGRIGIACAPLDGSDGGLLIRHALAALHAARPGEVLFAHQSDRVVRTGERRLSLAADLSDALDRGGLHVAYQPQVHASTGDLHGVEALLRWQHPSYGAVPPNEVVDVAERTGQLSRLTEHVLTSALAQRSSWLGEGLDLAVAVNVAAHSLGDEGLPELVARLLWESRTPAGRLVVEVTESGVMTDPDQALRVLHELTALGVDISIDDFGTGHSSLAYLDRLPVREVKIDRSLVQPLDGERLDSPVVRSTVALAHEIGLRVVAEGVETRQTADRLRGLGCDLLQGYLIGRPMPPQLVGSWLAGRTARADPSALPAQPREERPLQAP